MNSFKREGLEPKKEKTSKRILKTSLVLALMVFAFTMSSSSSFFQIIKPAEAASLKSVAIIPTSNVVNERATYEILFGAATTGTIKTIHIVFPTGFDISAATRLIERSGIGSGSLSTGLNNDLFYTLSSAESVAAGKGIRLEIGRIMNPPVAGNYKVEITTIDAANTIIDGPTFSGSFPIKEITGNDVSTGFMVRKTLLDDTAGNAKGWNPGGGSTSFVISDSDAGVSATTSDSVFISVMTRKNFQGACMVADTQATFFEIRCSGAPNDGSELHYVITKLPAHVVSSSSVSSTASIPSSPFD